MKSEKSPIKLTRRQRFLLLSAVPLYFVLAGFLLQPPGQIIAGIAEIFRQPDFLITDYLVVGGIGAAFVNAGFLTLMSIAIIYFLNMDMTGHTITSSFLMLGFSLFGKNLINIWAILAGVFLYARYHKTSVRRYIYVGLYGTSLSPIITQVMQLPGIPLAGSFLLSICVGILIGFVLPPLSTHVHFAHKGYSLYNVGFASGIIATVIVSLFRSFGIETASRQIWYTGGNRLFAGLLFLLFGIMIFFGLLKGPRQVLECYCSILKSSGISGTDYLKDYGHSPVMLNMGINGLFATCFVLAVGGELNGPTIGGIFTIVGFSATGKHLRNIAPIMLGVFIGSLTKEWAITDPSPMLALLFSTTLAPVAGEFGIIAGLLAGYLHSSVALNVGIVYGGMNLYNNGFAGGIVAIFLVPVIQSIRDRQARAKGNLSL
ncbi:MAG TPA: DUF1576 domain-containing protein [Candidatus Caccovicinus merdipullorum]|uniref:DUF1576 domain-containing protein n=1 Tax=Candidatus Caccovicinus merdipullorum TaxID=2840724 RepID=A0A9D1GHY5_9FIRM|nr:DUF1576 domain-containing protein [Candidatus Caccovicinus merdipullorum]